MDFHQTVMGSKFYGYQVPQIADALTEISKQLQRQNELTEKLIELKLLEIKQREALATGGRG